MKPSGKGSDPRYIGALSGKFVLPDRAANGVRSSAQTGRLQSISPRELAIQSASSTQIGERVSAVFEQIGRIDGTIARSGMGGFVVAIAADDKRRAELARTIAWLKKKHTKAVSEQRDGPRVPTGSTACLMTLPGGTLTCQLVDISASGAGFQYAEERPAIGSEIRIGEISGKVTRHTPAGFGIEFDERQELNLLLSKLTAKSNSTPPVTR